MKWEVVVGLEIHAQMTTASKLFCHCSAQFGGPPNSQICPICAGFPGALPVLNKTVADYAIRLGLSTNCKINPQNEFARKNYFYPDLPKGYQISQFDHPICSKGFLDVEVEGQKSRIGITRIHMEEDAGKLVHQGSDNIKGATSSLVDLNRSSVPLLEIVSEPDIRSAKEAKAYMEKMHQILRYLDICDGNMEEGSLRCDANISVRHFGQSNLGTKTEVKNLNSFKAVERAINIEVERQVELLEEGGAIIQETRHYNESTNSTRSLRSKEEAHDYRYFPDPDLVPLIIDEAWVKTIRQSLPELAEQRRTRYQLEIGLPEDIASRIVSDRDRADFFERCVAVGTAEPREIANWLVGSILAQLNVAGLSIQKTKLTPAFLCQLIEMIHAGQLSGASAKAILPEIMKTGKSPRELATQKGLFQVSASDEIEHLVMTVIGENPKAVEDIRKGKMQTFGFLVGQVMKKSQGKANAGLVNHSLRKQLLLG